jgi:hypothetical protein
MHSAQKIVPIPTTNVIIVPSTPEKQSDPSAHRKPFIMFVKLSGSDPLLGNLTLSSAK